MGEPFTPIQPFSTSHHDPEKFTSGLHPYIKAYCDDWAHEREAQDLQRQEAVIKKRAASIKRLVLLFDGTGNHFSDKNSNVLQFLKCLRKDSEKQLVYYQTGIGTYTNPSFVTPLVVEASMALDAATAWNIEHHVQDAYRFLMQRYKPGDKISLFGFSRGAYTARVLCGFVQKVGLLPPENHAQIPFAWNVFKQSDKEGGLQHCAAYKRAFSTNARIDFLGVWDTVASLGVAGLELPFSKPINDSDMPDIRVYRHALALDERRAMFTPNFKLTKDGTGSFVEIRYLGNGWVEPDPYKKQVREVWFAGCHCDVGGGSVSNTTRYSLARIPLRWMIRECFRMDTGISFDRQMLADIGFSDAPFPRNPDPASTHNWPKRSETVEAARKTYKSILHILVIPIFVPLLLPYKILRHMCKLIWYSRCIRHPLLRINESSKFILLRDAFYPALLLPFLFFKYLWSLLPGSSCIPHRFRTMKEDLLDNAERQPVVASANFKTEEEVDEDSQDSLQPMYDQLRLRWWLWWIFEVWPLLFRRQDSKGGNRSSFITRINLGRGRKIYGDAWNSYEERMGSKNERRSVYQYIEVHESVRRRMERINYRPRAWFSYPPSGKFCWEEGLGSQHIRWVKE